MAHYDIFRQRLAIKCPAYGYALWEPSPGEHYPTVQVGDVGFIRRGKFHRLFNALLPAEHPSHQRFGVPDHHEPLEVKISQHIDAGMLNPNNFLSADVKGGSAGGGVFATGSDWKQLSLSCSGAGAVLSLPLPARSQDTLALGEFRKWIITHIDLWYAFTRRLGLGITRMDDIVLVTGCHLARTFANIAFSDGHGEEQVSFEVKVPDDSKVEWRFPFEDVQLAALNVGPSGQNLPEHNCIFVRGYRVTRLLGILPRLRGAAEPTESPDEDEPELDMRLVTTPDIKTQDPLDVLLEYIATEAPDCDMALVHDDDLVCILREALSPDEVIDHLRKSAPRVWQFQCDGTSEAGTTAIKVATLDEYSSEAPLAQDKTPFRARWGAGRTTTIDNFPEDVLLVMFYFYRIILANPENVYPVWEWHVLAHVCRKWRQVVFSCPYHLGLRLICTPMTPVRKMLDIWPPTLPIIVDNSALLLSQSDGDDEDDSLIAALERRDRVCLITIDHLTRLRLERLAAAMQEPFPALTHLHLGSNGEEAPAVAAPTLPGTFMGGSAPRLQRLALKGISFTALPNFLLSPENLTSIELRDIPSTGYVSPEAMVAFLSTLTRLGYLIIESKSRSPPADPTSRRAAPPTRVALPALIHFRFKGVSEYLEDMVVGIDAPLLRDLDVVFFYQLIFDIPRLALFIHRTETLKSFSKRAELSFKSRHVLIKIFNAANLGLSLYIPCSSSDWQIESIVQLCGPLPTPSNVELLDIVSEDTDDIANWQDVIDHAEWLEILQLFSSVRELYVTQAMWHVLAPGLKKHAGERTMDVLPLLRDLFLERLKPSESLPETVGPFVAARKLAGHPVAVHRRVGQAWTTQAVD